MEEAVTKIFGYIDDVIEKWRLPSADEILVRNKKGWKLLAKKDIKGETGLSPPVNYFTDRSKAVLLFWIIFVICVSCLSCFLVCSLQPCGHLLGKG